MAEIEIRKIAKVENPPTDIDYVLIEPTPKGRFMVHGSVEHPGAATFHTPEPFDSYDEAISWASAWAQSHNVDVIFVKPEM